MLAVLRPGAAPSPPSRPSCWPPSASRPIAGARGAALASGSTRRRSPSSSPTWPDRGPLPGDAGRLSIESRALPGQTVPRDESAHARPARPLRDPRHPRRPAPRPDHRRGDDAGLPDLDLRPDGARASTRATSTPAPTTPPATRCKTASPRWRAAKHGLAFASGLAATDALLHLLDAGRPRRLLRRRLRRHLPPLRQGLPAPRPLLHARWTSPTRPTSSAAHDAAHPDGLAREPDQPHAQDRRPRRRRRHRAGARRDERRRQHLRDPVLPAAARAGHRRRRATPRPST